jgi:hypothetical protein
MHKKFSYFPFTVLVCLWKQCDDIIGPCSSSGTIRTLPSWWHILSSIRSICDLGSYSNECWDYKLLWCSSEQSCRYVLKRSLYLSPILHGMTFRKTTIVTLKLHPLAEPRGSTQLTSKLKVEHNNESVPYTCHLPKICLNYILFCRPSGISTTIFCFPYLIYISLL